MVAALLLLGCLSAAGTLWRINEASAGRDRVRKMFDRGELKVDEPIEVLGRLDAAPELAPDRIYLSIAVERVATLGRERKAQGIVQMVVPFNDHESRLEYDSLELDYGTEVRLLGHLSNRHGYRNPGAPDFDELLEYRGYDATGWVKSPLLIERSKGSGGSRVLSKLYDVRARAIALILRNFRQPTSGILAAALFGNHYFLSRDTAETFRVGGTFHILVISGQHIAMIAIVTLWLMKYLSRSVLIRYAVVLAVMWSYALMVGSQPSITRAVVMISIVMIGQLIFRRSVGPNTLAASAIVLLAWQPRDIFNPSFQLSFLTVLMVVVFIVPLSGRLKQIGEWQPSVLTPYPPRVTRSVKWLAETLFWDEIGFRREMRESRIHYRLNKASAAHWLKKAHLQRLLSWIVITLLTTVGVQVGLLPLMVAQFHRVSPVSPITNVVEGALLSILMIAGASYLTIHAVVGQVASKLAGVVNALGWLTVKSCAPLLAWRMASLRVPDFSPAPLLVISCYFAAVLVLIIIVNEWNPFRRGDELSMRRRKIAGRTPALASSLTAFILGALLIFHPFSHDYQRGRLSITFLDVGQGDAMLIRFPGGSSMMLDAGGRGRAGQEEDGDAFVEDRIGIAEAAVMPYLWHCGIKRLDWIVASHGDADHVEGFAEIVRNFEVGSALKGPARRSGAPPDLFDRAVDRAKLPVRIVKRGDVFVIDGTKVEILAPFTDADGLRGSSNNGSIVLSIKFGRRSFLLTGDIERETEARLVASATDLRADVLKVAHHGSRTSSISEFLAEVKPQHAVISVADPSPFGHPHPEVIERLHEIGPRIWRTSACGAITISTDGRDLQVETFVRCE